MMNKLTGDYRRALIWALVVSGTPGVALAQSTGSGAAPATAAEKGFNTDDIIVTARRREERAQDVPVSVVALSGLQLARANVLRIDDLTRVAPGFVVQASPFGNGALTVTLRSQRQNLPNMTYDPSVGIYFAEVVAMRSQGANSALYDLQSVQVLKGPQGTLFGRNTTGGALLITPTAPGESFGGYLKGGLGNYGSKSIEGAIDLPVSDTLKIRIAGQHRDHDGYIQKIGTNIRLDDERVSGLRGSIVFQPGSGFKNSLVVDWVSQDGSGTGYKLASCAPGGVANTRTGICNSLATQAGQPYYSTTSDVDPKGMRIRVWTVSNISTLDVGGLTLKNIAGYRHLDSLVSFDIDGSSANVLFANERLNTPQVTDELQLLGTGLDNRLKYILGGYFFNETGTDLQVTPTLGTPSVNDISVTNRSYSVFGQATYKIVPTVSFTAGLRETWDERKMTSRSTRGGTCRLLTADIGGVPINPCSKTVNADFNALTYNFSLDWKPTDKLLVYAATRRGYRAGGFANAASLPSEFTPYQPETVTDYELGLKSDYRFGGMSGRTNLAVYYGDYKDIQRNVTDQVTDPNNPSVIFTRSTIVNAAKGRIQGIEVEQVLRPVEGLELSVSYAYSDAKYKRFVLANGQNYTASPFAGAPKHILSGSIRADVPVNPEVGEVSLQLNGAYRSSTTFADVSSFNPVAQAVYPTSVVDAYTLFDARIDWRNVLGHPLTVSGWVRNLTNQQYFTAGQDVTALGFSAHILGQPRTFGIEARYDF